MHESHFVLSTDNMHAGVIVRSCYWLVYWRPKHLDDEHGSFGDELPSAIGAVVIEVSDLEISALYENGLSLVISTVTVYTICDRISWEKSSRISLGQT